MHTGNIGTGAEGSDVRKRFAVARETRASTVTLLLAAPVIVVLLALPAFASRVLLQELFYVFTMLSLAQLWNLLAGSAGLISVGQQAFVGVGAYALFAFTVIAGLDAVLSIVLSGALAGLVAIPAALIVFRLRGAYFAIGTWVVAEVCRLVLAQVKQLGGGTGTSLPPDIASSIVGLDSVRDFFAVRGPAARDMMVYWLALLLALGTFALVYRLLRSRHGLALSALGDSETAAESTGVHVFRTKFLIYVLTAVATGMVGALIFLQKARISPDAAFSLIDWTAYVIFIVVIGGIGSMEGPIIGGLRVESAWSERAEYLERFFSIPRAGATASPVAAPHRPASQPSEAATAFRFVASAVLPASSSVTA